MNINKIVRSAKCGALSALVAMGLTATAAEPEAVQLWEGGPYWAESNLGTSEVQGHSEYGALYNFADAETEVAKLGGDWRLPTKDELVKLANASYCTKVWDPVNKGYTFTGATEGYKDKSIFLPAAGCDLGTGRGRAGGEGDYWSSEEDGDYRAWCLYFYEGNADVGNYARSYGFSVRVVRDTPLVTEPTVTVGEVTTGDPWSKVTVNYKLGGTDATLNYKVAFDITAGGQTASVTNDAAKVKDKAYSQEIDTAALFGAATPDTKAKVKVSLIAVKPLFVPPAGQLWEGGPIWAESNLGEVEEGYSDHPEYGALYNFADAATEVAKLGDGWRLPTKAEFEKLLSECDRSAWDDTKKGYTFTGKGDYSSNSIFLPAAGMNFGGGGGRTYAGSTGYYWSSEEGGVAYALNIGSSYVGMSGYNRSNGHSVRAVRDAE